MWGIVGYKDSIHQFLALPVQNLWAAHHPLQEHSSSEEGRWASLTLGLAGKDVNGQWAFHRFSCGQKNKYFTNL